jgi:hypothetical protein
MIDGDMLAGGGGPPHDRSMEMRVQRLEDTLLRIEGLLASLDARVGKIEDRLRSVEIELSGMNGRMTNLPSTWAMITTMLGGQIAFAGTIVAILHLTGVR